MTSQARRRIVVVTGHAAVLVIHIVLVVFMAVETREHREVSGLVMASRATLPFAVVLPRENWEIICVVIEFGPGPYSSIMTGETSIWISRSRVLPVVIALMTSDTIALVNGREQWLARRSIMTVGADQCRVRTQQVETP